MASHKISTPNRGFTLLELLIIIGLVTIVAGLGLFVSFDDYRNYHFHNERDVIVNVLQKARSQAISNMCFGSTCTDGKAHGVYFGLPGKYVIFQGTDYASRDGAIDEIIAAKDDAASISGMTSVVFAPLSGTAVTSPLPSLTVLDVSTRTSVITIDPEGRIWWTN